MTAHTAAYLTIREDVEGKNNDVISEIYSHQIGGNNNAIAKIYSHQIGGNNNAIAQIYSTIL